MNFHEQLPNQFLNWRLVNGTKLHVAVKAISSESIRPGDAVNAHDPQHWVTHAEAQATGLGVAFVLTEDDPWFFLDMDKCRDDAGNWSNEAKALWSQFTGCWGEMSQSQRGLHIMGRCDKSRLADRHNKWDGWLEFYTKKRFIAFSDTGWDAIGDTFIDRDWTDILLKVVPERPFLGEMPDGVDPSYTGPSDDAELIRMALRSRSPEAAFGEGICFADLWNADAAKLCIKYPDYNGEDGKFDHSSADMALMTHLAFWTGKDQPRMDRLFRRSGLVRDKYEKRPQYRRETCEKAVKMTRNVYNRISASPSINATVGSEIESFTDDSLSTASSSLHEDMSHDELARTIYSESWAGEMIYILELDRWVYWNGACWVKYGGKLAK